MPAGRTSSYHAPRAPALQVPTEDDGIVPAHAAIDAATAPAASPEDGSTSSASTRIAAPRQTIAKPAADVETGTKQSSQTASGKSGKQFTISGERADGDEFGLDDDDDEDLDIGLGQQAAVKQALKPAPGELKQVRKE